MPALDAYLQEKLDALEEKQQKRRLYSTARSEGVQAEKNGKTLISFSCNDYLGLTQHPEVVAAARAALEKYGAGAGASRLVTGNNPLYDELEKNLANYKHCEAACVFGSGYLANIGTFAALVGEGDLILADKLSHACLIDGAKLSGAKLLRFAHNDLSHCRALLEARRKDYQKCLLVTETVFSMDGDLSPLEGLSALAREYDSWLLTDDAHGLGLLPPQTPAAHIIQMGTLSKAAGSYGGYVCGTALLVDYIKTSARSLIYSTALPPATLAASIAALDIIKHDKTLYKKPLEHAQHFTSLLNLPAAHSAIVPVAVKDSAQALELSQKLEAQGFLVAAIRPPTVPSARLRFTFSALHTSEQVEAVAALLKKMGVPCAS